MDGELPQSVGIRQVLAREAIESSPIFESYSKRRITNEFAMELFPLLEKSGTVAVSISRSEKKMDGLQESSDIEIRIEANVSSLRELPGVRSMCGHKIYVESATENEASWMAERLMSISADAIFSNKAAPSRG